MRYNQPYERSLSFAPTVAQLIYSPSNKLGCSISSHTISVIPNKVGVAYLKATSAATDLFLEQFLVTNLPLSESIVSSALILESEANKILISWFSDFDLELLTISDNRYKYSTIEDADIEEYIEARILDMIEQASFSKPKSASSFYGIKSLMSETERIEFTGEYINPKTMQEEITLLAKEVYEILGGTVPDFSRYSLYLEGNRRSEIPEREAETLYPVATIGTLS